jgi:DNA-directed RNA polymerase sigma subunit (sigma70/sigma32)
MDVLEVSFSKPVRQPVMRTADGTLTAGDVLQTLTFRERQVCRRYYGINTHLHTLNEIALDLGITTLRVEQIRARVVNKLQHPVRLKVLTQAPDSETKTILENIVKEGDRRLASATVFGGE